MPKFELVSSYPLAGDQPNATEQLAQGVLRGDRAQTLLGVTGSGKTMAMARLVELDELLASADIVSIHTFLSPETRHLLDARRLGLMQPGAYLVNTARGPIVDEAALAVALRSGRLAGAGLDVFEDEPLSPSSPLIGLDTVLLSPHLANYSVSGVRALWLRAADITLQVALGGLPDRGVVINKELYDQLAAAPKLRDVPRHGGSPQPPGLRPSGFVA